MFQLPSFRQLTKDQENVFNLPAIGTHLIAGPPGSGKTVVAVYRTQMLAQETKFLVYNKTLNQYLAMALNNLGLDGNSSTFHSWFCTWYKHQFRENAPQIRPYEYNWPAIHASLGRMHTINRAPNLIIDEGQDLPKGFFEILPLIAENITIFADENQRLTETNCTIDDIKKALNLEEPHFLKKNFRNTRPIAEFAASFYAGLPTGVPELPDKNGTKPVLYLTKDSYDQRRIIRRYAQNNPAKNIGVFFQHNDDIKFCYEELRQFLNNNLQMYISDDYRFRKIDFSTPKVTLLNFQSAKGLEFDTVFMPYLQKTRTDANLDLLKMRLYVVSSRARDELFLLSEENNLPHLIDVIDQSLFEVVLPDS